MGKAPAYHAYQLFFPAAACYGASVPVLSLAAIAAKPWGPMALAGAPGHAHEMLLGFALAIISGYLLGPQPPRKLILLFLIWLTARLLFLFAPGNTASWLLNAAFPLLLAAHVAPKFFCAAKKLRNKAFAPLLVSICLSMVAFGIFVARHANSQFTLSAAIEIVILLACLMTLMGGRIIAPAVAGQLQRQGMTPTARVQPRLEAALVILLSISALLFPTPHANRTVAPLIAVAGVATTVRLFRWRVWNCSTRPDLWCLAIGYGWLGVGLIILSGALYADRHLIAALHTVTVGALGSLSLGIMGRTRLQRAKIDPARSASLLLGAILVSMAALARGAASLGVGPANEYLWGSALFWATAFFLLARLLIAVELR